MASARCASSFRSNVTKPYLRARAPLLGRAPRAARRRSSHLLPQAPTGPPTGPLHSHPASSGPRSVGSGAVHHPLRRGATQARGHSQLPLFLQARIRSGLKLLAAAPAYDTPYANGGSCQPSCLEKACELVASGTLRQTTDAGALCRCTSTAGQARSGMVSPGTNAFAQAQSKIAMQGYSISVSVQIHTHAAVRSRASITAELRVTEVNC